MRWLVRSGWRSVALDELASESSISLGSSSSWSVFQNRFPKARRLAQAHAARDHGVINTFSKMLAHLRHDLLAKICSRIEHRHDDTANFETLVRPGVTHLLDQPHDFYQSFQREILALYRRQQFIGGGERVAHQDAKRRRTIQENEIKSLVGMQRLERFRQTREMIGHSRDFNFGAGQIEIGRYDKQVIAARGNDFFSNGTLAEQWFVKTNLLDPLKPKRAGRVRLRIEIDKQNAIAQFRERSAKVHSRRRFADAAFLVSDRDDFHSGHPLGLRHLSDDVVARSKRKLNFSNFRFGISTISTVAFKRHSL